MYFLFSEIVLYGGTLMINVVEESNNALFRRVLLLVTLVIVGYFTTTLMEKTIWSISEAILLKEAGVHTMAVVLEYTPENVRAYSNFSRSTKPEIRHLYNIKYDGYTNVIELDHPYYINDILPVLYDKNNPKLVWQGVNTLSSWTLWKINVRIMNFSKGDVFNVLFFDFLGITVSWKLMMEIFKIRQK